jgi:hypothetical protein
MCAKVASEKKRLFAGVLGILVLGTLAFAVVAFFRRQTTTLRPPGEGSTSSIALDEMHRHATPTACWIVDRLRCHGIRTASSRSTLHNYVLWTRLDTTLRVGTPTVAVENHSTSASGTLGSGRNIGGYRQ